MNRSTVTRDTAFCEHPADLSDQALALSELRLDPAFYLIPHGAREEYVERSLDIGRAAAAEFPGCHPTEFAIRLGARVVYSDSRPEIAGCLVRSEYDSGTHVITVYSRSITEVAERLAASMLRGIMSAACHNDWLKPASIAQIHIAHELFHHLETTRIGRTDERLPRVMLRRFGPITVGSTGVRRCREIAAHMFAKELLGLPVLPNVIDLCYEDSGESNWKRPRAN